MRDACHLENASGSSLVGTALPCAAIAFRTAVDMRRCHCPTASSSVDNVVANDAAGGATAAVGGAWTDFSAAAVAADAAAAADAVAISWRTADSSLRI